MYAHSTDISNDYTHDLKHVKDDPATGAIGILEE